MEFPRVHHHILGNDAGTPMSLKHSTQWARALIHQLPTASEGCCWGREKLRIPCTSAFSRTHLRTQRKPFSKEMQGLPWQLSSKESTCQCRRCGFNPSLEDPLEKEMATHSSILAWEIQWTEEPGGYSPWGR